MAGSSRARDALARAHVPPAVVRLTGFALLYAVTFWAGRHLQVSATPLALAWPAAGVATVWFLALRTRSERLAAVAAITVITGVLNAATGVDPVAAWLFGPVNVANAAAAVAVLRTAGWDRPRPVRTFLDVTRLLIAAATAAVVTALLGGVVAMLGGEAPFGDAIVLLGVRNGVSTFVVTSALLSLGDWSDVPGGRARAVPQIVACVVVAALVMLQPWPIAFVMATPLIVLALTCGPRPTSLAVALQGVTVVVATASGHGQFAEMIAPEARVLVAQGLVMLMALGSLVIAITAQDRSDALAASRLDRDRLHDFIEAALVASAHLELDAAGRVVVTETNAALRALTGQARGRLLGTDPAAWLIDDDAAQLAAGIRDIASGRCSGWRAPLRLSATHGGGWVDAAVALVDREMAPDGVRTLLKLQMIDITAQRQAEQELARAALHDDLTGVANRVLWSDRLRRALAVDRAPDGCVAVLFADVDHFKQINDAYGHDVGDEVLREVARRLLSVVRPYDTVARMGGDEFVLLCPDVTPKANGECPLALRIHEVMRAPVVVGSRSIAVTVSVGVGLADAHDHDGRDVLRRADTALYSAKAAGRARTEVYHADIHAAAERDAAVLLDLEQGQRAGELTVHYQPILDADTGQVVALEALLRWRHPLRGFLEPKDFLDVLETSELIHPVGGEVLLRACEDGAHLARNGRPVDIHVNISAAELERPGLADRVRAALASTGLDAGLLVLEVTETRLVSVTPDLVRELDEVRALGVRLGVDDFGTGYSTLTHLVDLPVGVVKLDRSFVADVTHAPGARSVSAGVRAMAEGLGVVAIAEGVETAAQAAVLRELGYQRLQGYYCGRPGPLEEILGAAMLAG